jgi:6-phosphofructokinase
VQKLGEELERRTGKEVRTTVLGHVQRGGTPTARLAETAAFTG